LACLLFIENGCNDNPWGGLAWVVGLCAVGGLACSSAFAGGSVRRGPRGWFGVLRAWLACGAGRWWLGLAPVLLVGSAAAALGVVPVVCLVVLFCLSAFCLFLFNNSLQ